MTDILPSGELVAAAPLSPMTFTNPGAEAPATDAGVVAPEPRGRLSKWLHAGLRGGQLAVAMAEVMPTNEAIRVGLLAGNSLLASGSPAVGAAIAGVSTFAIEAAGGYATAGVLEGSMSQRLMAAIQRKRKHPNDTLMTPFSKVVTTAVLGTAVGMTIEQAEDPSRTVQQNRRYSLRTSAWLAAMVAPFGAAGTEVIDQAIQHPVVSGMVGSSVIAVESGRRIGQRLRSPRVIDAATELWSDRDSKYSYQLVTDEAMLGCVADIEQKVWDEKGYGNLEEEGYGPYIAHSRTFAAFDDKGECVGLTRMFGAGEDVLPPFLSMGFDDEGERSELAELARQGLVEELGTAAVIPEARGRGVNKRLWRQAYRDARARGVQSWGIIMEPERVQKLNDRYGFTFRQVGPTEDYQGGDCAPHVMNFEEATRAMRRNHPLNLAWFTRVPLRR